jgi:hypothetical protein
VTSVTVTNCNATNVTGSNLTDVTVSASSFLSWSTQGPATRLTLSRDHFSGTGVFIVGGSSAVIQNCTFENLTGFLGLEIAGGNHNQVLNNTIDGGYDGGSARNGTDDAILLVNESNDTIQGNTISNVFDAGIEGVDVLTNVVMSNNTITNVGETGVGAYWCTNWTGNVVSGNSVSRAPQMVVVYYTADVSHCGPGGPPQKFTSNQIVGNRFRDFAQGTTLPGYAFPGMSVALDSTAPVSGNLIQGNDFGTQMGPAVYPLQGFIDGGGNICAPFDPMTSLPVDPTDMACAGGGPHLQDSTVFSMPRSARFRVPRLSVASVLRKVRYRR